MAKTDINIEDQRRLSRRSSGSVTGTKSAGFDGKGSVTKNNFSILVSTMKDDQDIVNSDYCSQETKNLIRSLL